MYYIIYMSTIKLSDIIKNDQIGGANVNKNKEVAPKLEGVSTTPDLKYIVLFFSEAIVVPTDLEIDVEVNSVSRKAKFYSFYGGAGPSNALLFTLHGDITTQLKTNPSAIIKVNFLSTITRDNTAPITVENARKKGFVGTTSTGILLKIKKTSQGISFLTPDGVQRLESVTEKPLSDEARRKNIQDQLINSLKPTFIEKASTQRRYKEGDVLWNDKTGYTDYLNMTDKGDKMEQKGRIFLFYTV